MPPKPITLSDRVRHLRQKANLTQFALAQLAGVRPEIVSRLETGKTRGALTSLSALARALGTTVEALIGKDPRPKPLKPKPTEPKK